MAALKSWLRGPRGGWFRKLALLTMRLACVAALFIAGCPPQPAFEQMIPGVTLKKIQDILADDTITDKDQALEDLGINDANYPAAEQLRYVLLNASLPEITTDQTD